jgi:hypothetical protein
MTLQDWIQDGIGLAGLVISIIALLRSRTASAESARARQLVTELTAHPAVRALLGGSAAAGGSGGTGKQWWSDCSSGWGS